MNRLVTVFATVIGVDALNETMRSGWTYVEPLSNTESGRLRFLVKSQRWEDE